MKSFVFLVAVATVLPTAEATRILAFSPIARTRSTTISLKSATLDDATSGTTTVFPGEERSDVGTFINSAARLEQSTFPIAPDDLIERAKIVLAAGVGEKDPDLLADDFEFCAPIIGPLDKESYLNALGSFRILDAFPDLDGRIYNIHVDPFETNRVWWMSRNVGTHKGVLAGSIKPTGKKVEFPPQAQSFTFNEEGKVKELTVGYVMDRRIGNTGGLGGMFGFFYAVGSPLPFPEAKPMKKSWQFGLFSFAGNTMSKLQKFFSKKKN